MAAILGSFFIIWSISLSFCLAMNSNLSDLLSRIFILNLRLASYFSFRYYCFFW